MIKPRRDKLTEREAIALKAIGAQGDRLIYGPTLAQETGTSEHGAHATAASLVRKGLAERRSTGAIGYPADRRGPRASPDAEPDPGRPLGRGRHGRHRPGRQRRDATRMRYTTPHLLERTLEAHLRRAGYSDAIATKGTRYVREKGRDCLQVSLIKYGTVLMDPEILKAYEGVLRSLPGVVRTQVIHDAGKDGRANPLRDQVVVIHLRMWDDSSTPRDFLETE
jgi:hypothetical protein